MIFYPMKIKLEEIKEIFIRKVTQIIELSNLLQTKSDQIKNDFNVNIDTISKDVLVDEYSFYIPYTFIPVSSESENKIFKGYGIGIEEYELKIFSRWCELIFKSNHLDVGWDGRYQFRLNDSSNNDLCPVGIYTYTVFIENIYGEVFEYQGQVKLLR